MALPVLLARQLRPLAPIWRPLSSIAQGPQDSQLDHKYKELGVRYLTEESIAWQWCSIRKGCQTSVNFVYYTKSNPLDLNLDVE